MRIPNSSAWLPVVLVVTLAAGGAVSSQGADQASLLLEAAIQKQLVTGDFAAAAAQYQTILVRFANQRRVAAQALWRLGQCQEQLGQPDEARQSYERLANEHSDLPSLVAAARARLSALLEDEEWADRELSRELVVDQSSRPAGIVRAGPGAGQQMIFSDLSVYDRQTNASRRLVGTARSAAYPVVSPNGREVAYLSWNGDIEADVARQQAGYAGSRGSAELRLVDLNGSRDRVLVSGNGVRWLRPYQWSPDGDSLLALIERVTGVRQVALVSTANGSIRVLKSLPWLSAQEMSFSPDGQFMAYQVSTPRDARQLDFVVLPVHTSPGPLVDRRYSVSQGGQRGVRVSDADLAVHVLNRLGFGPRQGDVERVRAMGIDAYITQQLNPEKIADPVVSTKLATFHGLKMDMAELLDKGGPPVGIANRRRATIFERPELAARAARERTAAAGAPTMGRASGEPQVTVVADRPLDSEIVVAKLIRAVHSERQLQEVLADFWVNHFNVNLLSTPQTASHFEEQAIRRHVFGRFEDMLSAVAHHPRMLFYLDNWRSSAPTEVIDERLAGLKKNADVEGQVALLERASFLKDSKGLNENFARELLELHTMGVDGGYGQQDVVAVAKILSGWTISTRGLVNGRDEDGVFTFDPLMHVDGDKVVLGQTIKSGGVEEGEALLKILARHPSTARFISTKLARRFISDDPPQAVIDEASRTFLKTGGDLREVVRTILLSPQFRSSETIRAKIKKPFELVASALRAVDATFVDVTSYETLVGGNRSVVSRMGEKLYNHEAPDGNPDVGPAWMNSNALMIRLDFANKLATGKLLGVKSNLASAERLLVELGVPRPTALQIQQTRAMLQSAAAPAAPAMGGNQMMMAPGSTAAAAGAPIDPAAITVAAMLGSPHFQKR